MKILPLAKLDRLLHPESVAIIGASPDKKKVGYAALRNMVLSGFKGRLYAINTKADQYGEIEGVKVYASINDVDDENLKSHTVKSETLFDNKSPVKGHGQINNATDQHQAENHQHAGKNRG